MIKLKLYNESINANQDPNESLMFSQPQAKSCGQCSSQPVAVKLSSNINVIIKITNACDYKCTYCFIEESVRRNHMSYETLEQVTRSLLTSDTFNFVNFIWHGGEPTLRGLKFFKEIVRLQKLYEGKVHYQNKIQTHGGYVKGDLLDFFVKHNFDVGLSLDGPKDITDSVRLTSNDASCYDKVESACRSLQDRGESTGACLTLSRANIKKAREVYQSFKDLRLGLNVIPLMYSGDAISNYEDLGITAEEYGEFMIELFDLWYYDEDPVIDIQPLQTHLAGLLGIPGIASKCVYTESCHQTFLGISPLGDMYPCALFQAMSEYRYGNIHEMPIESIPETPLWQKIVEREKMVLESCSNCSFYHICYSGCMYNSAKYDDFYTKDYYCEGYKALYAHITKAIYADIKRARIRTTEPKELPAGKDLQQ